MKNINLQVREHVRDQAYINAIGQVGNICYQVWDQVWDQINEHVRDRIWQQINEQVQEPAPNHFEAAYQQASKL